MEVMKSKVYIRIDENKRILRCETAPLVVLSALLYTFEL